MTYLPLLLPVLFAFPCTINWLAGRGSGHPQIKLNRGLFVAPILLLSLSLFSFYAKMPLDLTFFKVGSYFTVGLRLDILSGLIGATVLTIGLIIIRYSVRYLEDDPEKETFSKNLSWTLTFVLAMLMAPNLMMLFISWVGISYFLHQLLTHFSEREGAIEAATQKFWVSRFGDLFIISAIVILLSVFKTVEFDTIFRLIEDPRYLEDHFYSIHGASLLIVLGSMTKSAQFPFHYWLPNTMETPTPVSALMHAGIINAGGYLIVRMSPFLSKAPESLTVLALVGGFTAFWGALIMFTQPNVKKSLAYSTVSQMGFMMLQCGLGIFSIAVVHIIGHAFYKAFAFLSSGTATDFGRLNRYFPKEKVKQTLWAPFLIALAVVGLILGSYSYFTEDFYGRPGSLVLLFILGLAVSQIIMSSKDKIRSMVFALGIVLGYLALSKGMDYLLVDLIPNGSFSESFMRISALILCTGFFVVLYIFQNNLDRLSQTEFGKKLYVKTLRGGLR